MHIYGVELRVPVLLEVLTPLRGGWGDPQAEPLGPLRPRRHGWALT